MKPAVFFAILFLSLVALLHLLLLVFQIPFTLANIEVPMWASVLAVLGPGALAVWLWRAHKR